MGRIQAHIVGIIALALFSQVHGVYKLCAFPSMDKTACDRIEEGNSKVSCIRVTDSIDCSLKMKDGLADFALYHADEAVLAGLYISEYANVIGEARYKTAYNDDNYADLVVVVRKPFNGSFFDLRGKGYCHSGVGNFHRLSDKLLKSFERKVVQKFFADGNCNSQYSRAEQDIRDLEYIFGPSCRPGRWAADVNLDNRLKRRYRNMCRLCESPSQCTNGMQDTGVNRQALDCLAIQGGDVAFVTTDAVESFFGLTKGPAVASASDYLYLCPNETVMPINTSQKPCFWASQPWDLLVARTSVSNELLDKLNVWLADKKDGSSERWQTNLKKLLLKDHKTFVSRVVNNNLPIRKYIDRGEVDKQGTPCLLEQVEFCLTNDAEAEKCKWLQGAATTYGLAPPRVGCSYFRVNKWSCLENVANGKADVVSIPTDYGYIARSVFKMSTVFYEDNLLNANYKIVAVLKAHNSVVNGFNDLKKRRACFPEYNGLAWITFVDTVKKLKLLGKGCPENFFAEACAPGADSPDFSPNHRLPSSKLCNLCPDNNQGSCSAKLSRRDRNLRALQCLDNDGDIAFINLQAVSTYTMDGMQLNSSIDPTKYKVLCSNGTIINGLTVDDGCVLQSGIHGEIMGAANRNPVQSININELLLQFNKLFGTTEESTRNTISLYDKFRNQKGVLFQDNTIYLVNPGDDQYNSIQAYTSLLGNASQSCNGVPNMFGASTLIGVLLVSLMVYAVNV